MADESSSARRQKVKKATFNFCAACKTQKLVNDFYIRENGLSDYCKDCARLKTKNYNKTNKEKVAEKQRKNYCENREKILAKQRKNYYEKYGKINEEARKKELFVLQVIEEILRNRG